MKPTATATAPTDAPHARRTGYRQVFATRGFPSLFAYAVAGISATSLQILALSVLVYAGTGSAALSALAFAAGFGPQVLGGMLFTSLADRYPARALLVTRAVAQATVAVLLGAVPLPPAAMIALVAAVAVVQPMFSAAQSGLVPRLLPQDRYVLGQSVLNLASSGAQLAGLAVGGTAVAVLGGHLAMLVAAGGHALAAVLAVTLPATATRGAAPGAPSAAGAPGAPPARRWRPGDTWRGNGVLLRDVRVRRLLLLWWLPPGLVVGAEALVVAYVGETHAAAGNAGALLAALPAGAFLGDVVVGRFCAPATRERLVRPLLVLMGAGLLPLAAYPPSAVSGALLGLSSAGFAYQLGRQQAFLDAVPPDRRGQAFGLLSTGLMTGQGLGPVLSGLLAERIGAGAVMSLLGAAVVLTALLLPLDGPHAPVAGQDR